MIWLAIILAVFTWWFSTGAILMAVGRADRGGPDAHRATVRVAVPVLFAGIGLLHWSVGQAGPAAAVAGFLSAILIWGWIELAFLSGIVTGPVRDRLPRGATEGERFMRAWGTIAYHECLLVAAAIGILILSRGAEHPIGLWTFLVLFVARISAKLNVFFGIPRINEEFLPRPVRHLASYFRRRPINAVFPVSVTLLTAATFCWIDRAIALPEAAFGFTLLATLTALALVEHWLMVVPLPDAALWRWMVPAPSPTSTPHPGLPALHDTE